MREQLLALDELAKTDLAKRQIDVELSEIENSLSELRDSVAHIEALLGRERRDIDGAEKLRASHLSELESIAEKSQRSNKLRDTARNNRELEATQRAIDELKRQKEERTAEAAKLETQIAETRGQIAKHESDFQGLADDLKAEEVSAAKRSEGLRAKKAEGEGARSEAANKVRADLRAIYTMVFKRRGSAVAEVVNGICRACNMGIPPQLYNQVLTTEKVYQCPSCQRFLLPPSIVQATR